MSSSAASKMKQAIIQRQTENIGNLTLKEKERRGAAENCKSSDIIGDNIDISRKPSQMSVDRRRQSWHWFLGNYLSSKQIIHFEYHMF